MERPRTPPDDVTLIIAAITGAFLCVECIARKTGTPRPAVDAALARIGTTLLISTASAPCDGCLTVSRVFRLT